MKFEDILHRCFRCGYCKLPSNYVDINCPSYLAYGFETYSPGGRMWLIRAWLDKKIETSPRLAEIFFSCATCANCVEHCAMPGFKDDILFAFNAAKEKMLDSGRVPAAVSDYLTRVQLHKNPYGKPASKRADWAKTANIPEYDGQEYLFFAGDTGAYDPRGREIAASVAALLLRAGISIGVMADNETSDGNDVRAVGETLLAEELAKKN
ncbi:MAG: (Fe-S)-binding protein, partial [Deltaproteobacteria bacterium]|nr:(Fe-S)-binding protein [Deltaproteobacteria bacterium]